MTSDGFGLGLGVAFGAGLVSVLSPCVLPLVPSYLGFLTGMTLPELQDRRKIAVAHALVFVGGFSLVFILLGATATAVGRVLTEYQLWLQRAGGVLINLVGLFCLGLFRSDFLTQERRLHVERKPVGFLSSAVVGMAFAAGWTPCIGPVLATILSFAATAEELGQGMVLLGAYSAGFAIPFLVAAVAIDAFLGWFQRFRGWLPWVMRGSGGAADRRRGAAAHGRVHSAGGVAVAVYAGVGVGAALNEPAHGPVLRRDAGRSVPHRKRLKVRNFNMSSLTGAV